MKKIIFLSIAALLFLSSLHAQSGQVVSDTSTMVIASVQSMPEYPGGDFAMKQFIAKNIQYPKEALEKGIQGKVYVKFVIDELGNVTDVAVTRGVWKDIDEEAMRVIKLMPRWKPGIKDGKPVKVAFNVPIDFSLN